MSNKERQKKALVQFLRHNGGLRPCRTTNGIDMFSGTSKTEVLHLTG